MTKTNGTGRGDLSERAANLTETGAHYFIGWLISAGMHKPEIKAALDHVLAEFETDPGLRYCWKGTESTSVETVAAVESETSDVSSEQVPVLCEKNPDPAPTERERHPPLAARFMAAIFGKPRVAA